MRAVCYARVSSAMQRDRDTIESQVRVLPEFIQRQGWELVRPVGTYIDDGRTAKAGHLEARTGFTALMRDAVLGLFDVVVIVDIDRLTRSEDITERGAILGAFQRAGVKLASAASGQVLDLSTSTGDLFTSLHAFFAAEWTRKHRERVLQGKITSIKRNRKPAGRAPFGILYDKATGAWSLDPIKAPLVVELFERCAAGDSLRAITDDFARRGFTGTLSTRLARWNAAHVIRKRYARGEWMADRTRNLSVTVPPIVDEDLWQRANDALDRHRFRGLRRTRHEYLAEALGVCGRCGSGIMIRSAVFDNRRGGTWNHARYQCSNRRTFRDAASRCAAPTMLTSEADARLWAALRAELDDPGLAEAIGAEIAGRAEESDQWQQDAAGYRDHLARLERVEGAVLDRYRRGLISDNAMDAELVKLRRERDNVRVQLSAAEKAKLVTGDARERMDQAMRTLGDLRAALADTSFATRRKLVTLLVPKGGIVFDEERLKVTMLVPKPRPALVSGDASTRSSRAA